MIIEYTRAKTIEEAVGLLGRKHPKTVPLGGGTFLSRNSKEDLAVVDLQSLGLAYVSRSGDMVRIGASTNLEACVLSPELPVELREAIRKDVPSLNLRNTASLAGSLVISTGNSSLATCLMALDAEMLWLPSEITESIGDWLPLRNDPPGLFIKEISWSPKPSLAYAGVGRSPSDKPFLCVAVSTWPSGRTRITLGHNQFKSPCLILDGVGGDGYEMSIKNACSQLTNNKIYTIETSIILINRLLNNKKAATQ